MKGRNLLIMGIIFIIPLLILIPFWGNCGMGKSLFPLCVLISLVAIIGIYFISIGANKCRKQKKTPRKSEVPTIIGGLIQRA